MTNEKAIMCLEDMKIKVPIPKAAKQARKNNEALDVAIKALAESELGTTLAEVGTDCISRQQAIDALEKWLHGLFGITEADGTATIFKTFRQLPPIQPDIVRCKDCKYWIPYDWMFSEIWQSKNMADYPEDEMGCNWCDMAMKANDFCSRGEKREVTI